MDKFLTSNDWKWRLGRTVVQGIMGVVVANLDLIFGQTALSPEMRAMAVALTMAVLSPVMAALGEKHDEDDQGGKGPLVIRPD